MQNAVIFYVPTLFITYLAVKILDFYRFLGFYSLFWNVLKDRCFLWTIYVFYECKSSYLIVHWMVP